MDNNSYLQLNLIENKKKIKNSSNKHIHQLNNIINLIKCIEVSELENYPNKDEIYDIIIPTINKIQAIHLNKHRELSKNKIIDDLVNNLIDNSIKENECIDIDKKIFISDSKKKENTLKNYCIIKSTNT